MAWRTTFDLDRFAAAAAGYLRSRAAENTLLLSAAQAAAQAGQAARAPQRGPGSARPPGPPARADPAAGLLLGWWEPPAGGEPRGAFLHEPGAPLLFSGRVPETAASLAATLARLGRQVIGVDAPPEAADAFAAAWSQRSGTAVRVHRHCRVYRLLPPGAGDWGPAGPGGWPPPGVPSPVGRLRVAGPADLPLLATWLDAFAAETSDRTRSPRDVAAELIGYGGAVFWEVPGKPARLPGTARPPAAPVTPVALAALTRPVAGTVRVGMVYTPPDRRRSGYAAAVTLGVSHALLGSAPPAAPGLASGDGGGADGVLGGPARRGRIVEVVMITDMNRADHWGGRFGFQLAGERTVLRFGPVTGPARRLQATGPSPRLPTGPLPRLPRLPR
jgi:hypothetical protein